MTYEIDDLDEMEEQLFRECKHNKSISSADEYEVMEYGLSDKAIRKHKWFICDTCGALLVRKWGKDYVYFSTKEAYRDGFRLTPPDDYKLCGQRRYSFGKELICDRVKDHKETKHRDGNKEFRMWGER